MALHLEVRNGVITRRESADHSIGNQMRRPLRDAAVKPTDGNSPFNEAFSFTPEEYSLLQKIRPDLFDKCASPKTRLEAWKRFANSTEGRMFRVR